MVSPAQRLSTLMVYVMVVAVPLTLVGCTEESHSPDLTKARRFLSSSSLGNPPVVDSSVDEERFRHRAALTLEANRKRPYVLRKLVQHYRSQKQWARALQRLDELIHLQPLEPRWYLERGQILGRRSGAEDALLSRAEGSFRTAIRLGDKPHSSVILQARYGLGLLLAFRMDRDREGAEQFRRVLQARETVHNRMIQMRARMGLGRLAYERGDWSNAQRHFRNVALMEGIPSVSRSRALMNLSRTFRERGQDRKAKQVRGLSEHMRKRELSLKQLQRRLDTLGK